MIGKIPKSLCTCLSSACLLSIGRGTLWTRDFHTAQLSGEPGRRGQEAKWRTGLSEMDWTVSRKRYFIGVAYVCKSGLTLGKEVCRLLSMNAGDMCIFCGFS